MYIREPGFTKSFGDPYDGYVIDDVTGKIIGYVVEPKITPEENRRRWERVEEVASRIAMNILASENSEM